jgi:hypothetical protein
MDLNRIEELRRVTGLHWGSGFVLANRTIERQTCACSESLTFGVVCTKSLPTTANTHWDLSGFEWRMWVNGVEVTLPPGKYPTLLKDVWACALTRVFG